MPQWESRFNIGDRVVINHDISLIGTITAIIIRKGAVNYELSYVHNGACYSPIVEDYRLTAHE